jgi:hypothetical protein
VASCHRELGTAEHNHIRRHVACPKCLRRTIQLQYGIINYYWGRGAGSVSWRHYCAFGFVAVSEEGPGWCGWNTLQRSCEDFTYTKVMLRRWRKWERERERERERGGGNKGTQKQITLVEAPCAGNQRHPLHKRLPNRVQQKSTVTCWCPHVSRPYPSTLHDGGWWVDTLI